MSGHREVVEGQWEAIAIKCTSPVWQIYKCICQVFVTVDRALIESESSHFLDLYKAWLALNNQ